MLLLATSRTDQILPELLPWLALLLGLVVVGAIVLAVLRRHTSSTESDELDGFTLHGLRELHARGELTEKEFERAKASVIERAKASSPATGPDNPGESEN